MRKNNLDSFLLLCGSYIFRIFYLYFDVVVNVDFRMGVRSVSYAMHLNRLISRLSSTLSPFSSPFYLLSPVLASKGSARLLREGLSFDGGSGPSQSVRVVVQGEKKW